ncbi:CDC45-like protein-domain-containing protein [Blyttiomyces helicus]|uniref:CDC45-like protein-domain-containing protein n=1 Tax=Blyttiomyces helicus TaxID=388810 RepID=A0A4P9W7N9_9FUNG|nr:CDC45-like protein-domain-containing protein [Blyttiomyces helicus]|eukprot:RKO88501.1 CDC45-like protein-domain-containing protein [Blyttiomyces helicus]
MNITFKRTIREKLQRIAPSYNIPDILFPSFYKHYGWKGTVSAADAVYSITALLDCGVDWIVRHRSGTYDETGGAGGGGGGAGGDSDHAPTTRRAGRGGEESGPCSGGLAGVGVGTRTGMAALRVGDLVHSVGWGFDEDDGEEEPGEGDATDAMTQGEEQDGRPGRTKKKVKERDWVRNFYIAYDALDKNLHLVLVLVSEISIRFVVAYLELKKGFPNVVHVVHVAVIENHDLSAGVYLCQIRIKGVTNNPYGGKAKPGSGHLTTTPTGGHAPPSYKALLRQSHLRTGPKVIQVERPVHVGDVDCHVFRQVKKLFDMDEAPAVEHDDCPQLEWRKIRGK